jgi:glycosyltransferase involved in cell wall biosynthesis
MTASVIPHQQFDTEGRAADTRGLKPPKIAIVNDIAGVARAETRILREAGYDVTFFDLPGIGASWPPLAKALAMPVRLASYLPIIVRLRCGGYDFLHIHFITQGIIGLVVGKPYFIHAHGSDLHVNFGSPLKKALSLKVLRHSRGVFYATPNLRQFLQAFEYKAYFIGNPIDTGVFRVRRNPSVISDVLVFARLEPVKGVDRIFEKVEELSRMVRLTAIAWGPWAREYRKRYGEKVRFIEPVPHAQIPFLLDGFDAVIGQMRQGILSLSELEALAVGRVVITGLDQRLYRTDPPPVAHASNGDELISTLKRLIDHPEEASSLSRSGPAWIERHHSPKTHLRHLRQAYARA